MRSSSQSGRRWWYYPRVAIKFSAVGLFRTEVRHFIEGYSHVRVGEEEKKKLEDALSEMEGLAIQGTILNPGERLVGPNVDLPVHAFLTENNLDPERTAALMHDIHELIKPHFVQGALYRQMGRAFEELDAEAPPDLAKVIGVAREKNRPEDFCPQAILNPINREEMNQLLRGLGDEE